MDYLLAVNVQFVEAGLRGMSTFVASGDLGVCGKGGCSRPARFKPDFPASSPYVIAVGGIDFATASIGPEVAWRATGGGFPDTFEIPDYQADAVKSYKARADASLTAPSSYNDIGRGCPDVAAFIWVAPRTCSVA